MCKVSCVLFILLLINSCGFFDKIKGSIDKIKGSIDKTQEHNDTQKTLEEELREVLSESQNKGLDFLKRVLKEDNDKLNNILSVGKDKLERLKVVLENIQGSIKKCYDSRSSSVDKNPEDYDPYKQREAFKDLVVEYVEKQLSNLGIDDIPPLNPLETLCVQ